MKYRDIERINDGNDFNITCSVKVPGKNKECVAGILVVQ